MRKTNRTKSKTGSKFGRQMIEGLHEAARHAQGDKVRGMRVTTVEIPDVKCSANQSRD